MASGGALQRVRRDSLPALRTEKSRCAFLQWWWQYAWEGPDSVRGNSWCLWSVPYAPVPQWDLYDGVAAGEGRLGPFLVIGGDGCGGVVFPALDDVEGPDV